MSVSIISCPSCKNLVLSDTVQCPTCQHVLKPEHANANAADLPAVVKAAEDEVECPDCGEQVRSGLVRCWRCGGFLREDIAEKYQKMLDGPQQVTYSLSTDSSDPDSSSTDSTAGDDDFQLADGLNLMSEDELHSRQAAASAAPVEPAASTVKEPDSGVHEPASASDAGEAPASNESSADEDAKSDASAADAPSTGDPLLDIALQEENEAAVRAKDRRKKKAQGEKVAMPGFLFVFCPNGHRIQV